VSQPKSAISHQAAGVSAQSTDVDRSWHAARISFSAPLKTLYGDSETDAMWWRWYEYRTGGNRLDWINRRWQPMDLVRHKQLRRDLELLLELRPLAYVLDEAWFMNRKYALRGAVLIPRPETEELVAWVLDRENENRRLQVLDVGCGSGAIACSIGLERPNWKVRGMDIDLSALSVARLNARKLHAPVRIHQVDMRAERWPSWDVVVCNPPYIGQGMEHTLSPGVAKYEPHLALFAPQADPLYYYRVLANQLRKVIDTSRLIKKRAVAIRRGFMAGDEPREPDQRQPFCKVMYMEMPSDCAASIRDLFGAWDTEMRCDAQGVARMLRVSSER